MLAKVAKKWPKQVLHKKIFVGKQPKHFMIVWATFARQFLAQTFQNLSNLLTLLSSKSKCSVTRFVTTSIVFYYLMLSHCKAISIRNLARFHGKHSMQFTLKQPQGFREMRPIHLSNQGLCPKSFKISQQKVKKKYRILF